MGKDQKVGDPHKVQKSYDKKKKTTITTTVDGRSSNNNEETTSTDEDIMIFPKQLILKQTLQSIQTRSGPPRFSDISDDDDDVDFNYWNKEQWIKSDSDCKSPIWFEFHVRTHRLCFYNLRFRIIIVSLSLI